ncbi:MAG: hypothetical protein WDA16_07810 [Candidatus Thermoplasmatota archaeon]
MPKEARRARGKRAASILQHNSIPFLFFLADNQGWHKPTAVTDAISCGAKYAVGIAKRLRGANLAELREAGRVAGKPIYETRVTDRGRELAIMLHPVVAFLEDETPVDRARARRRPVGQ